MSKYLYRCLQNYDRVEVEDVVFDGRDDDDGEEFDKSQNAITLSPQRRPQELVSTCVRISPYLQSVSSPLLIFLPSSKCVASRAQGCVPLVKISICDNGKN